MNYPKFEEKLIVPSNALEEPYLSAVPGLDLISRIIGIKLEVTLKCKQDILSLLRSPEEYIADPVALERIKDLAELLSLTEAL